MAANVNRVDRTLALRIYFHFILSYNNNFINYSSKLTTSNLNVKNKHHLNLEMELIEYCIR